MEQQNGITTAGSGTVRIAPDIARVSIGVTVVEREADAARTAAATALAAVITALKARGVAEKDLRTSRLSLAPEYDYNGGKQKRRGYRATHDLLVVLRDIDRASEAVDAASVAGGEAIAIHGLSFEIDDPAPSQREALVAAYADARARAEALAGAAGVSVGAPISIEERTASAPLPYPVARMAMMAESAPTPIAHGENEVTASVVVTWAIA